MSTYSAEKFDLIRRYIQSESDEFYGEKFDGRYDIIMVVDWREFDEDIIEYCENALETTHLSVETIDVDNKRGFDTFIEYNGKKVSVPYQGEGADRDTTIITLNEVIKPAYEIRLCKRSIGNDTLEFLPLPKENWDALENEFPGKVDEFFQKINIGDTLFQ
jgi:hypothetical protein